MLPLVSVAASLFAYFFLVAHETLFEFLFFTLHQIGPDNALEGSTQSDKT